MLITFEGLDASGKSTQAKFLNEYLKELKFGTLLTRQPGGTSISEQIRKILLDKDNVKMSDVTEFFLFTASRAQHIEEIVNPALAVDKIVICSRFIDSMYAYQSVGRGIHEQVIKLASWIIDAPIPDLTFVLDIPSELAFSRVVARGIPDRIEREGVEYFDKVREGYLELYKRHKKRITWIDGTQSKNQIRSEILERISEFKFSEFGSEV